ncbi:MAG TPA: aldo/keto reductase [Candidatus Deferrimicrobium sp.]|nr:aldo/keto reductase [Candidatus Deferrimicrobium sp.]
MRYNVLGNTDIKLSALGIGAWAMGGGGYKFGWGSQDDKDSIHTIHRAIELGINWIDTAPIYGEGHSEEIIGLALKELQKYNKIHDNIFISTKCGIHIAENKEDIVIDLNPNKIREDIEISLKKLQMDTIDLYHIHMPGTDEQNEIAWSTLEKLKKEGKIRYTGVSNFSLNQLEKIHKIHPVSFIQPFYNMLDPSIESEILNFCHSNHIGVLVFSPMYRGLLTGDFTKDRAEKLTDDDNRNTLNYFKEPYLSENLQLVEHLRPIAGKNNKTVAQLALAWVLRRPEITSAIVGARKPHQIEGTAPAGDWILSEEVKKEIDCLLAKHYANMRKYVLKI